MVRPRAIFDANLYLNILLSPDPDRSAVGLLIRSAAELRFDLLVAEDVVEELSQVVARRSYLAARVSQETIDTLFRQLLEFATPLPLLDQEPPQVSRDLKDDYLIALAVVHEADFLVTRDRDLLSIGDAVSVRIVDPAAFLTLLRSMQE